MALVERKAETTVLQVSLPINIGDAEATTREIIFVVDRSGSMAGSRMRKTKAALGALLRALPESRTYFNIVSFGSTYRKMFSRSCLLTERSFRDTQEKISRFEADMGGTVMTEVLEDVLSAPLTVALTRDVIVLTDGQVRVESAVFAITNNAASLFPSLRIFTIALGKSASASLCQGMAVRGACVLAEDGGCNVNVAVSSVVHKVFARNWTTSV
jgi:uncharacterized protein with von Willebrand factor type A (vWA) domain